jgi:hypothetical protein
VLLHWLTGYTKRQIILPIVIVACACIGVFSRLPGKFKEILPVLRNGQTLRAYHNLPKFGVGDFKTAHNLALVDYLKSETLPCDTVYLWGFEPAVYFLSGRSLVTRFVYNFPMFTAFYRQSYRDEFMEGLRSTPPSVFIVEHDDRTPHVSIHNHDSAEVLEQFKALNHFVETNYAMRGKVDRFDVYFRNDFTPGTIRSCPAGRAS